MNKMSKQDLKRLGISSAAALAFAAGTASAAVDVSSVTASVTDAATAGGVLGLAILAMYYGIKLFKWIKAAG